MAIGVILRLAEGSALALLADGRGAGQEMFVREQDRSVAIRLQSLLETDPCSAAPLGGGAGAS